MKWILASSLLVLSACSGMQKSGNTFTAHAESFNIIGFQIPGGQYEKALSMVPQGADVHTITSNPTDLTSGLGVLNRILGVSYTEVSGKTK